MAYGYTIHTQEIGKEIARKLSVIGVDSAEQLEEMGSRHSFFQLKERFSEVCLVHRYTLEAAIEEVDFNALSAEKKDD